MAKFQDTVEILIQARDEARRELQGIRQEVAKTRDELSGGSGIVANAARLHHALQKIGATTDGIKSGIAVVRGLIVGARGDSEGMLEAFKQIGFGIGEVINQADMLSKALEDVFFEARDIGRLAVDFDKLMAISEVEAKRVEDSRSAQAQLRERIRLQSLEFELLNASSDEEKERIRSQQKINQVLKEAFDLRKQVDELSTESHIGKRLAERLVLNATLIEQRKQELRQQKAAALEEAKKTAELEKQKRLLEEQREASREAQREYIRNTMAQIKAFATNVLRGRLEELRRQAASIAPRESTISLGQQSGRFATGLRDQQAAREDPMIQEQRKLRESFDRKIEDLARQIKEMNKRISGRNIRLIPLTINAGASF